MDLDGLSLMEVVTKLENSALEMHIKVYVQYSKVYVVNKS